MTYFPELLIVVRCTPLWGVRRVRFPEETDTLYRFISRGDSSFDVMKIDFPSGEGVARELPMHPK